MYPQGEPSLDRVQDWARRGRSGQGNVVSGRTSGAVAGRPPRAANDLSSLRDHRTAAPRRRSLSLPRTMSIRSRSGSRPPSNRDDREFEGTYRYGEIGSSENRPGLAPSVTATVYPQGEIPHWDEMLPQQVPTSANSTGYQNSAPPPTSLERTNPVAVSRVPTTSTQVHGKSLTVAEWQELIPKPGKEPPAVPTPIEAPSNRGSLDRLRRQSMESSRGQVRSFYPENSRDPSTTVNDPISLGRFGPGRGEVAAGTADQSATFLASEIPRRPAPSDLRCRTGSHQSIWDGSRRQTEGSRDPNMTVNDPNTLAGFSLGRGEVAAGLANRSATVLTSETPRPTASSHFEHRTRSHQSTWDGSQRLAERRTPEPSTSLTQLAFAGSTIPASQSSQSRGLQAFGEQGSSRTPIRYPHGNATTNFDRVPSGSGAGQLSTAAHRPRPSALPQPMRQVHSNRSFIPPQIGPSSFGSQLVVIPPLTTAKPSSRTVRPPPQSSCAGGWSASRDVRGQVSAVRVRPGGDRRTETSETGPAPLGSGAPGSSMILPQPGAVIAPRPQHAFAGHSYQNQLSPHSHTGRVPAGASWAPLTDDRRPQSRAYMSSSQFPGQVPNMTQPVEPWWREEHRLRGQSQYDVRSDRPPTAFPYSTTQEGSHTRHAGISGQGEYRQPVGFSNMLGQPDSASVPPPDSGNSVFAADSRAGRRTPHGQRGRAHQPPWRS